MHYNKRIFLSFIPAGILLGIIFVIFAIFVNTNKNRIIEQNKSYVEDAASQTAGRIDDTLTWTKNSLEIIAYLYGDSMTSPQVDLELLNQIAKKAPFEHIAFVTPEGINISIRGENVDVSDRFYFQDGMQGKSGMAVIFDARTTEQNLVVFYTPLRYRGEIIGVLVGHYVEEQMRDIITTTYFGVETSTFLCMLNGDVVSSASPYGALLNMKDVIRQLGPVDTSVYASLEHAMQNQESYTFTYKGKYGEGIAHMVHLPQNDEVLVQTIPSRVTGNMLANANAAGILLEVELLLLFAACFLIYLFRSKKKRRKLLDEKAKELQYMEWLFSVLTQNTDDVYVLFSPEDFGAEYVSPNLKNVLGLEPDMVKENARLLFLTSVDGKYAFSDENLKLVMEKGSSQADRERRHCVTGERRWYHEVIYHMTIQGTDKFLLMLSDRTMERQMNETLNDALNATQAANQAKSHFLANISHDIRTPMNAVVGFATLLERDYDQPRKVKEYTKKLMASGRHLMNLINDVLDMSKIESGKAFLNMAEFEMSDLLEELMDIILPQAKAKGHQLEMEVLGRIPQRLLGDKLRINQILLNLLSNAVNYTPEGGEILFLIECLDEEASNYATIKFVVTDNGIGMSEEFIKTVFDPFAREVTSTTNSVLGTGLGMAITKNLVDLMGGTIGVQSEVGKGSEFVVELKFAVPKTGCLSEAESVGSVQTEKEIALMLEENQKKESLFLLVEDNELNAEIMMEILKGEGILCEQAVNGKEALERFEQSRAGYYDMILMDVQMPIMSGYEATMAIRQSAHPDAEKIPIIAMTANAFAEDVQNALNAGMNAHIAKPVDINALKGIIESWK